MKGVVNKFKSISALLGKTNAGWGLWKDELEFLLSHVSPSSRVLEWGMGYSTLALAKRAALVQSIEHDQSWYDYFSKKLPENVRARFVPADCAWPKNSDGNYEEFKSYVDVLDSLGQDFDIVLIDGRARVACARKVMSCLRDDVQVFVHDYRRQAYHEIENFLRFKELRRTLAHFTQAVLDPHVDS